MYHHKICLRSSSAQNEGQCLQRKTMTASARPPSLAALAARPGLMARRCANARRMVLTPLPSRTAWPASQAAAPPASRQELEHPKASGRMVEHRFPHAGLKEALPDAFVEPLLDLRRIVALSLLNSPSRASERSRHRPLFLLPVADVAGNPRRKAMQVVQMRQLQRLGGSAAFLALSCLVLRLPCLVFRDVLSLSCRHIYISVFVGKCRGMS